MDLYSRRIIGYAASTNLKAEQTSMKALKMALACRSIKHYPKLTHHSDRGSQYRYQPYIDLLSKYHIQLSMCREVYDNAHRNGLMEPLKMST
jgi:transposase InsO family protein